MFDRSFYTGGTRLVCYYRPPPGVREKQSPSAMVRKALGAIQQPVPVCGARPAECAAERARSRCRWRYGSSSSKRRWAMPSSTGSRVTRLAQSFLRCAEPTAWQATAWAASIASCGRGRLAPICTTSPTSHPAHLSTPHASPPAWQTTATALPESAASCTSVWGARAGVCVASPEAVASRPHVSQHRPTNSPPRLSPPAQVQRSVLEFQRFTKVFDFSTQTPISPICRTPLVPYLAV